jgi:hypothetical protein
MSNDRREIKFLIPLLQFKKLESKLLLTMTPDTIGSLNGQYRVRSLYFDSFHDDDYYDVLKGVETHKKIRLRRYPPQERAIKLEYKSKRGINQQKTSISISRAQALQMINGDYAFLTELPDPNALPIYSEMATRAYQPKILIEYERQAYTAPGNDIRITFDTNIQASYDFSKLFSLKVNYTPLIAKDYGVLEVKYNGFLYTYLQNLLRCLDMLPSAMSKYVLARESMH